MRKGMRRRKSRSQWGVSPWGSTEEFNARVEREQRLRAGIALNNTDARVIAKRKSRPDWRVERLYEERDRLTRETGIPHEVDHIRSPLDGGTHTRENLRIITQAENRSGQGRRSEDEINRLLNIEKNLIEVQGW